MEGFHDPAPADVPVVPVTAESLPRWLDGRPERVRRWVESCGFQGDADRALALPAEDGSIEHVLFGRRPAPGPWSWAALRGGLPAGRYAIELGEGDSAEDAALGWALAGYRFARYKTVTRPDVSLAWPAVDRGRVQRQTEGVFLARDLVNTPAGDLGPEELAGSLEELGTRHGARYRAVVGDELLAEGYPAVHAVGRASSRPPRLADLAWGDEGAPKVTLVGKGVVFDSGGLDLKPAEGMKLMKKDMGGAATVIGLAHAVMDAGLPIRLRVLVPAVENAVSGNAYHPLDVLPTRRGKTVEVGNTDAEGRLILCDALAEADSEAPELLLDFATLTGAARVALGTELPALFARGEGWSEELLATGEAVGDPLWPLPLHADYRRHIDSPVADLSSTGKGRTGGAITAALFLSEFVDPARAWGHVDTMAWNESDRPGRPAGGEAFGLRATYRWLARRYGAV